MCKFIRGSKLMSQRRWRSLMCLFFTETLTTQSLLARLHKTLALPRPLELKQATFLHFLTKALFRVVKNPGSGR
jgi:hypothetical protein